MTAQVGPYVIRDLMPWEGPELFKLTGDPRVTRYLGLRTHETVDEATQLIARYVSGPSKWQAICAPEEPADILGVVGIEILRHQATLTLMFRQDGKARGAGRKFALPFVAWIFTHPQIWRLWSYVHVDNIAGQRVTERLGAEREGRLRRFEVFPNVSTEPQDCYVYSIVKGGSSQDCKTDPQNPNGADMTELNMEPMPAPLA